ncbi:MAG TPA: alkaline phosphatase family protein [archaeon]|nr:alkaline phosphatase family protein [archaeon]
MQLPDYHGGSIVNLMSSIAHALGGKHAYAELRVLPAKEIKKSKKVVLLAIDGMGYEFLRKNCKETVFEGLLKEKITSIFPSTTAAAITAFLSGVPAQQHALTGWFVFLKEIGIVSKVLPFEPRIGKTKLSEFGVKAEDVLDFTPFSKTIKAESVFVSPKKFKESEFNRFTNGSAKSIFYSSMGEMFKKLGKEVRKKSVKKKFIYAYWGNLDHLCHLHGTKSKKTIAHFKKIALETKKFLDSMRGTDSTIIITADHGLIDGKTIWLEKYPELQETLVLPLCGDARIKYAYVKQEKRREFEKIVRTRLSEYCQLFKSSELVKKNYFGLFKPHKKLFDRIGDYTLITKKNFALRDVLPGEPRKNHIGNHAGLSKEEMFVPLIVVQNTENSKKAVWQNV